MMLTVIQIVVEALGTVPKNLEKRLIEQKNRNRDEQSTIKINSNT